MHSGYSLVAVFSIVALLVVLGAVGTVAAAELPALDNSTVVAADDLTVEPSDDTDTADGEPDDRRGADDGTAADDLPVEPPEDADTATGGIDDPSEMGDGDDPSGATTSTGTPGDEGGSDDENRTTDVVIGDWTVEHEDGWVEVEGEGVDYENDRGDVELDLASGNESVEVDVSEDRDEVDIEGPEYEIEHRGDTLSVKGTDLDYEVTHRPGRDVDVEVGDWKIEQSADRVEVEGAAVDYENDRGDVEIDVSVGDGSVEVDIEGEDVDIEGPGYDIEHHGEDLAVEADP